MKKILFLMLFAVAIFAEIHWQKDYQTALQKAQQEQKPLFVFMERLDPPCRWCEKMKKFTLSNKEIASTINKHFIAVKVTREKRNYPSFLHSKYVPAIFILDHNNKPITKVIGYWDVNDFKSDLRYILDELLKKR